MERNPTEGTLPPGFSFIDVALPDLAAPAAPTKLICLTTAYGDTLSEIGALFGIGAAEIARMNAIADPDRIYPGQRLVLRVPASVPIAACESYAVRRGDTLAGIADRLGIPLRQLVDANPQLIEPGQTLNLQPGDL